MSNNKQELIERYKLVCQMEASQLELPEELALVLYNGHVMSAVQEWSNERQLEWLIVVSGLYSKYPAAKLLLLYKKVIETIYEYAHHRLIVNWSH
ncbi:hypothetical protein [Scytonema sp. NUACC26]|uniref:hypothetical protein n=1 Tax=Scytonema sp. NUACC26 TaxID=3140176 RepID=UPI0034DB8F15